MTQLEQQWLFTKLVAQLVLWAYDHGYTLTYGEAWRPGWVADIYAEQGKGIANSLHRQRLAVDLMLFINGTYQTDSAAYLPLGAYWASLHPLCRWGGQFSKPDGVHFSMEWMGVK